MDSKIYGMAITQWEVKPIGIEPKYISKYQLEEEDRKTIRLPKVETNYRSDNIKAGKLKYTPGDEAVKHLRLHLATNWLSDEKRFPDFANPVQMSFDNKTIMGPLWLLYAVLATQNLRTN